MEQREVMRFGEIREMKKELEELRLEADYAEASADLTRAAEIRYAKIPKVEKDLEAKSDET